MNLLKNKTHKFNNYTNIFLKLDEDFPFDIDQIIIKYTEQENKVEIISEEIPSNIKLNMLKFYKNDIVSYIHFLEENLETFFKGELPTSISDTLPHLLPYDFQFPISKRKTFNIEIKCNKRNIQFLSAKEINLEVECKKCFKRNRLYKSENCSNCYTNLVIEYEPNLMCDNLIGNLNLNECKFLCFNYNKFQISCATCNLKYETNEMGPGNVFNLKCYKCYEHIFFKFDELVYKGIKTKTERKGNVSLSGDGTCEHYKKSFRWLRFPCCNRLFSCDICHDKESDHRGILANKMVCGLCKKEQGVKASCECGMNLKQNTQFWEGGKGTRNKLTMSKKDSKKYKN